MKIEIKKVNDTGDYIYCADMVELCGSPPVGYGKSPEHAIADLFVNISFSDYDWKNMIKDFNINIIYKDAE